MDGNYREVSLSYSLMCEEILKRFSFCLFFYCFEMILMDGLVENKQKHHEKQIDKNVVF